MAQKKTTTKKTKKSSGAKRHYPVVRRAELGSTSENQAVRLLDSAAELSKLNRRLYRYARVYPVSISTRPGTTGVIEVYALRDDWAVHQGLQHAYKAYLAATADERANMSKSQIARWEDFRCHDGIAGAFNPLNAKLQDPTFTGGGSRLTSGEFTLTEVVDASGTTRQFTWGTPSGSEYGILQEYDKAGNAQPTPSSLVSGAAGPYSGLEDGNDADVYTDLEAVGNEPPYDATGVNAGTPWVKVGTIGTGAADQKLSTGFFNAPCGLVVLVGPANDWNSDQITFEVKAGQYKGVGGMSLLE